MDGARNAVIANASVVRLLVIPARATTNVDRARNAVIVNASVVRLLVIPARATTNVDRARNAVIVNASVVRLLAIPVRPTNSVIVERIVVGEFVPQTVVGAAGILQAQLSARLSSSSSSFPSYPAASALVARSTAIVHPVLQSAQVDSRTNEWPQTT